MAFRKRRSNTPLARPPDDPGELILAELDRLRAKSGDDPRLERLLHELQAVQEELAVQNFQLREAQAALEETRDKFADLYHFAPIAFLTMDGNGVIRELNLTASTLLGRPRATLEGSPFLRFVRDEQRREFLDFMRSCRGYVSGDAPTVSLTLATPASERDVEIVCSPRPPGRTDAQHFLAAIVDLTERNRLESERRQADEERERLKQEEALAAASAEAKDHFLARLSHELRTPLTPVLAALTDPRLIMQAPPELRDLLSMMRRDIELEIRLIDDLLDVTRISRNRLVITREPVDVHLAIAEVMSMLQPEAAKRATHLTSRPEAASSWVTGDPTRLRQVLWNLLNNALKFTPQDGHVTIATTNTAAGGLEVQVVDSGRGMDADTVRQIFHLDERGQVPAAPEAGLGLGLSICQGIVEAHGGTIHAASTGPEQGSTFSFVLPDAFTAEREPGQESRLDRGGAAARSEAADEPLQILLVEDDEDTAAMMSMLLELHRYHVDVAGSVADAVTKAGERRYDLLISDIRLPDGTGLDLMRRLGGRRARSAIAVSGFGSPDDVRRSLEAGFDEHLVKPLNMATVLDTIGRRCGRAPSAAG